MARLVAKGRRRIGPPNAHILETEINGDISLYDPTAETVTVLNGTASDIWRLSDGEHTLEEIVGLLASAYAVSPDSIADEVADVVENLVKARLLESR